MGDPGDAHIADLMERALGLAEETLEQIARIAVEQIRKGVESSNHVEAPSATCEVHFGSSSWQSVNGGPHPRLRGSSNSLPLV